MGDTRYCGGYVGTASRILPRAFWTVWSQLFYAGPVPRGDYDLRRNGTDGGKIWRNMTGLMRRGKNRNAGAGVAEAASALA